MNTKRGMIKGLLVHAGERNRVGVVRATSVVALLSILVLVACTPDSPGPANSPGASPGKTAAPSAPDFRSLVGRWVRPDGGYVVEIRSVSPDGKLDASYANPTPLPFSRAEATREGSEIRVFLELTAGGYNGSTYTLSFDPAKNILRGVYFQAVAKQRYDIHFERAK